MKRFLPHLRNYCESPTPKNWERVLASAVPFDRFTLHCHAVGTLLTVQRQVWKVVLRPRRGGALEKRLVRFNKSRRSFYEQAVTPENLQAYADMLAKNPRFWGAR